MDGVQDKRKKTARQLISEGYEERHVKLIRAKASNDLEDLTPAKDTQDAINKVIEEGNQIKKKQRPLDLLKEAYSIKKKKK
jgi:hypothetical protein